ncbi:hypothetical protein V6N13_043846 [Hibiscus sabdariffa]
MLIRDEEVKVGKHMCGSLTEDYKLMEVTHGSNGIDDSIQELPRSYVVETSMANGLDNSLSKDIALSPLIGIVKEPPMHIVHIAVEMAPSQRLYVFVMLLVLLMLFKT